MSDHILLERRDGIAYVTFNRPEQRNAINYAGWLELQRLAAELGSDDSVRVVVFAGAGEKAFSAGADIVDFEEHRDNGAKARRYAEAFDGALTAIGELPKPTISRIHGFCVGGGCEFATTTDIRIVTEDSRFGIPIARLGLLIGYVEMSHLVNLVGTGAASYLLLSGRLIDAQEALRIGLVTQVVGAGELESYTDKLAGEMAQLAPLSQKHTKTLMRTLQKNPGLQDLTPAETELPYVVFDSDDYREGRTAFVERRVPKFKGR